MGIKPQIVIKLHPPETGKHALGMVFCVNEGKNPHVRANIRFVPTSGAGFRAVVGANLVFARSENAKINIVQELLVSSRKY